jgi:light-regulated signal transduction histidine kinase (bacteriophytochrome)
VDPTPARLDFIVLHPVWHQSWFILLMVVGFGAIATLAIRVWLERGQLRKLNLVLDQRVRDRTSELEAANKELEAFSYSVSHDLRAPLRHVVGFLELLEKRITSGLDEKSSHYIDVVMDSTHRMGILIDELLSFSRMGRQAINKAQVDLGSLVEEVMRELEPDTQGRDIRWQVGTLPVVTGDSILLKNVLINLLSNAIKFTQTRPVAEIDVLWLAEHTADTIIVVRDNGVGFEMAYADKLFGVFQRLHRQDDFEGTGIGLANVRRIISRHGGRVWAEGRPNQGAAFYFALPVLRQTS